MDFIWVLFGSFFAGILVPFYTWRKTFILAALLLWVVIGIGLVGYYYASWMPPKPEDYGYVKIIRPPQSREENAIVGFFGFFMLSVYALMLYFGGFAIRLVFDILRKKRKKK